MSDLSAFPITKRWPAKHPDRLQLYSLPTPNGVKVSIMLEEIGLPYEVHLVDFNKDDQKTPEFLSLNPNGKIPAILDPDGPGGRPLPLFESGAILLYLAEGTPLLPDDRMECAQVARWLLFEQADVVPTVGGLRFRLATARLAPDHERVARARAASHGMLRVLDAHLRGREFFVADRYSVADIAIYGYVHVAHEAGVGMEEHPEVARWLERVAAQPGYMNDLEPYPPNARAGAGRSLYG
jgi:GST-like protein